MPRFVGRRRAAITDQSSARDIARGVYEDVIGPHQQTHRLETP